MHGNLPQLAIDLPRRRECVHCSGAGEGSEGEHLSVCWGRHVTTMEAKCIFGYPQATVQQKCSSTVCTAQVKLSNIFNVIQIFSINLSAVPCIFKALANCCSKLIYPLLGYTEKKPKKNCTFLVLWLVSRLALAGGKGAKSHYKLCKMFGSSCCCPFLPLCRFAMYLSVRHVCVNCAEVRALSGNWVFSVLCDVCCVLCAVCTLWNMLCENKNVNCAHVWQQKAWRDARDELDLAGLITMIYAASFWLRTKMKSHCWHLAVKCELCLESASRFSP